MDIYYLECDGGKKHPLYFDVLEKLFRVNGLNIQYNMKRAPKELANRIENIEHQQHFYSIYQIATHVNDTFGCIPKNSAMIFFSKPGSRLNNLILQENKKAIWGGSTKFGEHQDFGFSVTYPAEDNPNFLNVQIHETLHLFGLDDCYDANLNPKPGCDNPECIMRYETPSLEICGKVKEALQCRPDIFATV